MKECRKQVESAKKIIEKLYEIDMEDLCTKDVNMLYKLLKNLRKRIYKEVKDKK